MGDKIRFEVTVKEPAAYSLGIIEPGGRWYTVTDAQWLGPGVHYLPDDAIAVDGPRTAGEVVFGVADAVARARTGPNRQEVATCRLTPQR